MLNNSLKQLLLESSSDEKKTFFNFITPKALGDIFERRLNVKDEEPKFASRSIGSLCHIEDKSLSRRTPIRYLTLNTDYYYTSSFKLADLSLPKCKKISNSKTQEFTSKPKATGVFKSINHYSDSKSKYDVKPLDRENMFDFSFDKSPIVHKENMFSFDNITSDSTDRHDLNVTSDLPTNATTSSSSGFGALEDILLLDCRSFMSFNDGHIVQAHNVNFPNILQRRCKKKIEENVKKCCKKEVVQFDGGQCKNVPVNNLCMPDLKFDSNFSKRSFPPLILDSSSSSPSETSSSSSSLASSPKLLLPLESIVTCDRTREKLMSDRFDLILVYDDHLQESQSDGCSRDEERVASEKLILVMNTLRRSLPSQQASKLRYLQGGYSKFVQCYPHLIEKQELNFKSFSPPPTAAKTVSPLRDRIKWNAHNEKGDPTEILPWLFLGSVRHANRTQRLVDLGITALLNVASENKSPEPATCSSPFTFPQSSTLQHACIPVVDSLTSEIGCHFESAISFIEKVRRENGKVLVHCSAGVSRSPAVCLAYLIDTFDYTLEEAYDFLRSKRDCIAPNFNFMRQLQEFEKNHFKEESTPSNETDSLIANEEADANMKSISTTTMIKSTEMVSRVKKDKLMSSLSSLCMENKARGSKHDVRKMLLRLCSNNLVSKKSMLMLLKTLTSKARSPPSHVPAKSSILKIPSSRLFIFSGVDRAISSSAANNIKRSDRLFMSLMRDLQHNMKKVQCKDSKNGEDLCNHFQVEDFKNDGDIDNVGLASNEEILEKAQTSADGKSKNESDPLSSHKSVQTDSLRTNIENESSSPAKKARPSSLSNRSSYDSGLSKSLQPWQRFDYSRRTFPKPSTFDSVSSLPQSPRSPQTFPLLTSSLGSLQQTFPSTLIPILSSSSSSEAASHPSSPSPQHSHVNNNKRKIIVSLLTPTCNQEAAFSFDPPASIGGLLPSPTPCHSPLLSPS